MVHKTQYSEEDIPAQRFRDFDGIIVRIYCINYDLYVTQQFYPNFDKRKQVTYHLNLSCDIT